MIVDRLPAEMASRSRTIIGEVDDIYRSHTVEGCGLVWEPESPSAGDALYRRVPVDLREPLLSGLRRAGIVR
ncbi:MAG TPA: hypothetical protein VHS78_18060 [Candidatus Elarobacter sp.]|jgi:hypothetical protein|nr:hypothetical protein [Candidatus Elarobacter sp.]